MRTQRQLFEAFVHDETSVKVCELVGPNCIEYDRIHDDLCEDRAWRLTLAKEWRKRRRPAANDAAFNPQQGSHP